MLLALAGSAIGVLLACWAPQLLLAVGGDSIPRPGMLRIDLRVMVFALLVAGLAALMAELVPALQASPADPVEHLREGGREGGAR